MGISRFMAGRYGIDALGWLCVALYVLLALAQNFVRSLWMYVPIALFLGLFIFRAFSRNVAARRRENDFFLARTRNIRRWFARAKNRARDRKTHLYFKCPACHNTLRVPRGRGNITVTCPVCREQIKKRT